MSRNQKNSGLIVPGTRDDECRTKATTSTFGQHCYQKQNKHGEADS